MNIFKTVQQLFKKEKEVAEKPKNNTNEYDIVERIVNNKSCETCPLSTRCDHNDKYSCLEKTEEMKERCKGEDGTKPVIVLLDDNDGILSLLEDDLYTLDEEGYINIGDFCIVKFSGVLAVFEYLPFLRKNFESIYGGIFDLTIGGVLRYEERNVRLTGMDAIYANVLRGIEKNVVFTGNTLNPNIQSNTEVIKQYRSITGRNLQDDVIYKSSFSDEDRRKEIYEKMFKGTKYDKKIN